jgi:hypothetical protein
MKKPKYTRYVQRPFNAKCRNVNDKKKPHYSVNRRFFGDHGYLELGFLVSRLSASLHVLKRNRDFALKAICKEKDNSKCPLSKYCREWFTFKQRVNEIIKRHSKRLKSAEKALKVKTEILGITTLSSI